MRLEDYDVLVGILQEFQQEREQIESQIYYNIEEIKKADACLKTFTDSESEDMKVFSPRKADIIYKEEIQQIKIKKAELEKRNQELLDKRAVLDGRIGKLKGVLKNQRREFSSGTESGKDLREASVKSIKRLAGKIEKSCVHIDQNPIQARQDLIIVARQLQETAKQLQDAIRAEQE